MMDARAFPEHATGAGAGLSAEGVTVSYRNGVTALREASFALPVGTISALVGVNGAGKSTLFKAIMGFCRSLAARSRSSASRSS